MTPRQRVLTTVSLRQPDRLPIDFGGTGATSIDLGAYQDLKAYLGVDAPTQFIEHHPWPDPNEPVRIAGLAESAETLHINTDYAIIMQVPSQVLPFGAAMCGNEGCLIKLATDPKFAETLIAKAMDAS